MKCEWFLEIKSSTRRYNEQQQFADEEYAELLSYFSSSDCPNAILANFFKVKDCIWTSLLEIRIQQRTAKLFYYIYLYLKKRMSPIRIGI